MKQNSICEVKKMNFYRYWKDILKQDANAIRGYLKKDAYINWHCTNEHFNVDEFIVANCEYPGNWDGEVERIEKINDIYVTVTHVYAKNQELSFNVTSFIKVEEDKIVSVDEYWADDGNTPQWRKDKKIGRPIMERRQDGI